MDVSENSGFSPKSSILIGLSIIKPSILGYPNFWKHPYAEEGVSVCQVQIEGKESYISGSNHPLKFLFKKSVKKTYLTSQYFGETNGWCFTKISLKSSTNSNDSCGNECPCSQPGSQTSRRFIPNLGAMKVTYKAINSH